MGKQESAVFIDMLFISIHWQLFMIIIWGVIFLHFICFPFFAWMSIPSLKPILFLFVPFHCPSPVPSPPHTDEQPVKVKRKKSFNLSRKFPFYKSKENIVQELVESEREYPLCDQRGWWWWWSYFLFFLVPFLSMLQFSLSPFIFPLRGCLEWCHHSHPCLYVPERSPAWSWRCGLLCGVPVCLSVGSRGVSSCVCELLAVLTIRRWRCSSYKSWSILQPVPSPQQESH